MPSMTTIARLDDLNFYEVLAATAGPALVYFTAPSCAACKSLKHALERYSHYYPPLPMFEVDAVHNGGLVRALEVFHLPALFLYVNGHYHRQLHCEVLPGALHHAIETALKLPAEEEP